MLIYCVVLHYVLLKYEILNFTWFGIGMVYKELCAFLFVWMFIKCSIFTKSSLLYVQFYTNIMVYHVCILFFSNVACTFWCRTSFERYTNRRKKRYLDIQGVPQNMTIARRLESRLWYLNLFVTFSLLSTLTWMILKTIIT